MLKQILNIALLSLTVCSGIVLADAPLKTALGLDIEQARRIDEIQSIYRRQYAAKREVHNREERALRRARIANDSKQIAVQEKIVSELKAELRQITASEDGAIRKLLTPEQSKKFDDHIKTRNNMVGSSRDVRNQ
ncbi:MAG: Spy/CpxP family protein refolding chaperone [Acidobacteria bacterium]|nr:Spy/CpxP family protein refolding chaperone [Acidobacteriota bacterium]